jgi:tRNA threonylcarbamoyladenosine biosynthesis protein TsaE
MTADLSVESKTTKDNSQTFFGEFVARSVDDTFSLARRIGEQLSGNEVFLLRGELGVGKTVFAKGLAAGLGLDPSDVTSPTFTLINPHKGRLRFFHVDLYRLDAGDHEGLGLDEIFDDAGAVTAIEWPERLEIVPERSY